MMPATTPELVCWQCGAPAQRERHGYGACPRHCLPTKEQRKGQQLPQQPTQPTPIRKSVQVAPVRTIKAVKPALAVKVKADGIVSQHMETCAGEQWFPACPKSCKQFRSMTGCEHVQAKVTICAEKNCEHNKLVTYYGGGLPLKRASNVRVPAGAVPASFDKYLPCNQKAARS